MMLTINSIVDFDCADPEILVVFVSTRETTR